MRKKEFLLVIGLALLFVASMTALAQDSSRTITINGGRDTVYMGPLQPARAAHGASCVGFYDNICGSGYESTLGFTVCDGVGQCHGEWSPGNQFTSLKTGTTKKVTLGLGFVQGTNRTLALLTKDCSGAPCTDPDGNPKSKQLCHGTVKNMPFFASTSTITVSFKCKTKLRKGSKYWVVLQSPVHSWLAWNLSLAATGPVYFGKNDHLVNEGTRRIGALKVQ